MFLFILCFYVLVTIFLSLFLVFPDIKKEICVNWEIFIRKKKPFKFIVFSSSIYSIKLQEFYKEISIFNYVVSLILILISNRKNRNENNFILNEVSVSDYLKLKLNQKKLFPNSICTSLMEPFFQILYFKKSAFVKTNFYLQFTLILIKITAI